MDIEGIMLSEISQKGKMNIVTSHVKSKKTISEINKMK